MGHTWKNAPHLRKCGALEKCGTHKKMRHTQKNTPTLRKCVLSRENAYYGYSFERLKTVRLPFPIRLSSVRDRWNAVRTDWIIRSEKNSSRWRGCCYPFERNLYPFERLRFFVRKKSLYVRTAEVIRSIKIVIRWNG